MEKARQHSALITMGRGWHIVCEAGSATVARQLPVRFDVSAQTALASGHPVRIAQQIRQDLWRALQNVRGFSPVVQVTRTSDGLHVKAGGRLLGPVANRHRDVIAQLLADPAKRARWQRCALEKQEA